MGFTYKSTSEAWSAVGILVYPKVSSGVEDLCRAVELFRSILAKVLVLALSTGTLSCWCLGLFVPVKGIDNTKAHKEVVDHGGQTPILPRLHQRSCETLKANLHQKRVCLTVFSFR